MDFNETKQLLKLKDGYRGKELKRQTFFTNHKFGLQKKLFELKDAIAQRRHTERIQMIKIKAE